jgi:hypothetical protein
MVFGSLFGVVPCLEMMAMSYVSVMAALFVMARLVVLCCFAMVLRRMFVLLCREAMMFGAFFRHMRTPALKSDLRIVPGFASIVLSGYTLVNTSLQSNNSGEFRFISGNLTNCLRRLLQSHKDIERPL